MATVALVTGANKGIGLEVVRQLAARDFVVYAGSRDGARAERAHEALGRPPNVRWVELDVTDGQTIEETRVRIDRDEGRLDVLVNNAGRTVPEERPTRERPSAAFVATDVTAAQMRATYETNVFGVVAVTHALMPLLRRSKAGRIVNVSSALGSLAYRANPENPIAKTGLLAYSTSKTALNGITLHWAAELRPLGILVNAANPGFVATDLNSHSGLGTAAEGAAVLVTLATLPDGGPTGTFVGDGGAVLPW